MAKREPGATLPVLPVQGTHADLGRAMGRRQAAQIQGAVAALLQTLHEQETSEAEVRRQIEPFVEAAERIFPHLVVELREMARAADVSFDLLFRLNCYEARPPGTAASAAGAPHVPAKDPGTQAAANSGPGDGAAVPAAVAGADGCTSVVSRGRDGVVVGHTEDSYPEAVDGLYLLDATVMAGPHEPGPPRSRFRALNYAQTLPGCAAAVNEHGLIALIDALPDPERQVGAPRHFVSRALLDVAGVDEAIDLLRSTLRGGGWNYVLAQGTRVVNVETTATRVAAMEVDGTGTLAHTNHYVDATLAAASGDPRPNSFARLTRALELVRPGMSALEMKALLSDRQGFPDSICRERTIGAFVADTASRRLEVCWGEPDSGAWSSYPFP